MENKIITIEISDYLTREIAEKIALAQYRRNDIEWVNRITDQIFDDKNESDCFHVTATNQCDEIVGRVYCIRNEYDNNLWYYGDLFVATAYRRNGIAEKMVKTAINHLSNIGASTLRCYVLPDNIASKSLQKKLGFVEKENEPFNFLIVSDQLMYEKNISQEYTYIKIDASYVHPVLCMYMENSWEFCGERLLKKEISNILSDCERENYLICKGCMPIGWFCTQTKNTDLYIEYFIVHEKMRHKGVGKQMLKYAITLAKEKGLRGVNIYATDRNLPAKRMAMTSGFEKVNSENLENDSFGPFIRYTYFKTI